MKTQFGWIRDLHFHAQRTPCALVASCAIGMVAPSVLATPEGGTFVTNPDYGQILQSGPAGQTVTNVFLPGTGVDPSNRHIINWASLDLGSAETLNFSGVNGYSVMNRISNLGTATSINGTLNAMTGNVYIVNSAGVVFGQNAIINAAGFHAAAASWSDGDAMQLDFLAGSPLTFNTTGDVEFHGTLNGIQEENFGISLLGQHVRNTGDISGRYIVMAAGDRIVVEDLGSRFSVMIDGQSMDDLVGSPAAGTVTADLTTGDPGIHNSGTVTASAGGNVSLVAGDLLGLAIRHDGEIHANGGDVDLLASGGAIWTSADNAGVATSGLIDVSDDDQSGTIDVSGAAVVVEAPMLARGHAGSVSIQGHSNVVLSGDGVVVTDGGMADSDGGDILLRASDGTVWAGAGTSLSAKGGLFGGNGGTIEVDGQTIALKSAVKLGAVSGDAGQLDINVHGPVTVEASGDPLESVDETDLSTSILVAGATSRIGAASGEMLSAVDGDLRLTSDDPLRIEASMVNLQGTAEFTSNEIQLAIGDGESAIHAASLIFDGSIVLEQSAELGGDDYLRLQGGGVSGDETTSLLLSSGGLLELEGDMGSEDSRLGDITLLTGHTVSLLGGTDRSGQYIHTSGNLLIGGAVEGTGGEIAVSAAEAVVVRAGGDISLGGDGAAGLSVEVNDDVDIEAGGTLTNLSDFDVDGSLRFVGGIVVNDADLSANQGITIQALTGDLETVGALDTVEDINLAAANTLTNDVSLTSSEGSIRLESFNADVVSLAALNAAETVSVKADAGSVVSTGEIGAANVILTAGNDIAMSGNITGTSSLTVASSGGDITTSGGGLLRGSILTIDATAGSIDVTSDLVGQTVGVTAADHLTILGDVTGEPVAGSGTDGDVTLTAQSGELTVNGDITGSDVAMLAAGGGVTFSGSAVATGDVAIDAQSGELDLSGSITAARIAASASSDGTVQASTTSTSGGISLNTVGDLTVSGDVHSATIVEMQSTAGGVSATADISAASDATLAAATELIYVGEATAGGDLTLAGQRVEVTSGKLVGATVSATSSGDTDISADVNSSSDLMITSTAGAASYDGNADVDGSIIINADANITLAGQLEAASIEAMAMNGSLTHSASTTASGSVAIASYSGHVMMTSAGDVTGNDVTINAGGNITHSGTITTTGGTLGLIAGGDLTHAGTIDGGGLVVMGTELGGIVTLTGDVAAAGDLDVLASQGGEIDVAASLRGSEVLLDATSVRLSESDIRSTTGNLVLRADDLSIAGQTVLGSESGLVVAASSTGAARVRIDDARLTLTAADNLDLLATVDGTGGVLEGTAGGRMLVGGDIGATLEVQSVDLAADELVLGDQINGQDWFVSQLNAQGDISLNGTDRETLAGLPTVYGFGPSLSVKSSEGNVRVGENNGLAYLGDLSLEAKKGIVSLGDTTTLGDLTIHGGTVEIYNRDSGALLSSSGAVVSDQTSIVSGGTIRLVGYDSDGLSENDPRFAAVVDAIGVPDLERVGIDAFTSADMMIGVPVGRSARGPVPADKPAPSSGNGSRLTLRSLPQYSDAAGDNTIAAESHPGEQRVAVAVGNEDVQTSAVTGALGLAALGIELVDAPDRSASANKLAAAGHFVDDISHRNGTVTDQETGLVRVTRSRLNDRYVQAAVVDYVAALDSAPEAGSMESARDVIREAKLEWEAESGDKGNYRRWLAEGGSPIRERAARILADLDAVFRDLRLAGLTRAEVEASRRFVNAKLSGDAAPVL